jgi:hypothetical protein
MLYVKIERQSENSTVDGPFNIAQIARLAFFYRKGYRPAGSFGSLLQPLWLGTVGWQMDCQ